jgi:hypothetical protein
MKKKTTIQLTIAAILLMAAEISLAQKPADSTVLYSFTYNMVPANSKKTIRNDSVAVWVTVKGKVINKHNRETLPFVTVRPKAKHGLKTTTQTNTDGYFSLTIPDKSFGKKLSLVCTYLGFYSKTITIKRRNLSKVVEIEMEGSSVTL